MRTRPGLRMAAPGAAAAFLVATVAAMPVAVALLPATLLQAPLAPAPGGGPAAATNGPGAARPGAGDARSLLPPRGGSRWPADPAAIAALLAGARGLQRPGPPGPHPHRVRDPAIPFAVSRPRRRGGGDIRVWCPWVRDARCAMNLSPTALAVVSGAVLLAGSMVVRTLLARRAIRRRLEALAVRLG